MPGTPATTPRLGIDRYANSDSVDFSAQVNAISDRVDVTVGRFESGLFANRPATGAGIADRYYWSTDTKEMFRDTGGATPTWENVTRRDEPIVTALPATPYDGQVIHYLASTLGIVWQLRYRAASPNAQKWEKVGGPPLYATAAGNSITSATSAFQTGGPAITLPLAGAFLCRFGLDGQPSTAGGSAAATLFAGGVSQGVAAVVTADATGGGMGGAGTAAKEWPIAAAAGAAVELRFSRATTGASSYATPFLIIDPVRVG